MNDKEIKNKPAMDERITLLEFLEEMKVLWKYLLSKWKIILVFGLGGGGIGLVASLLTPTEYKAHLSFALIDNSGSGSGLAVLASSFGLGNFGVSEDAFSGDNLLEIIQSRYAIEKTLLTPVDYKGKKKNLVEVYIDFNGLRNAWKDGKEEFDTLSFPVGQKREDFTRAQDSLLYTIYYGIVNSGSLSVVRKDKKIGVVNVDFTSGDEIFSKLFVEKLMAETYQFYTETRTSQTKANVEMMQAKADSIKHLYESSLYKSAAISQINLNAAIQIAAVPKIKQEHNAQLYATVYAEVLKNLETLKLDLARQTPLVQIIDTPRFPLEKYRLGKAKGMVLGGLIGGMLIVIYLLAALAIKNNMKNK
ncbi:MAG: lipopolysaccharide biosynthesis protein [Tissierellia bacterium]|nr:lipopolysaccharide biosynthesis protein [Tissierellia bacterium]